MYNSEENNKNLELLEEAINKFPQALKNINNTNILKFIEENYLPYSTGFEIECNNLDNFNIKDFESIPDIINVDCDTHEKRFRIPKGLKGLICLDQICNKLIDNCSLNMGSGIHYHTDMTDIYELITEDFIKEHNNWVINELIKWNTAKEIGINSSAFCSRARTWVRYADEHKTLEIRIGEMSFFYEILVKRIIDCNRITRYLKSKISKNNESLINLNNQLKNLNIEKLELDLNINRTKEYKEIIHSRTLKLNK